MTLNVDDTIYDFGIWGFTGYRGLGYTINFQELGLPYGI
jgi:hypothetical protein